MAARNGLCHLLDLPVAEVDMNSNVFSPPCETAISSSLSSLDRQDGGSAMRELAELEHFASDSSGGVPTRITDGNRARHRLESRGAGVGENMLAVRDETVLGASGHVGNAVTRAPEGVAKKPVVYLAAPDPKPAVVATNQAASSVNDRTKVSRSRPGDNDRNAASSRLDAASTSQDAMAAQIYRRNVHYYNAAMIAKAFKGDYQLMKDYKNLETQKSLVEHNNAQLRQRLWASNKQVEQSKNRIRELEIEQSAWRSEDQVAKLMDRIKSLEDQLGTSREQYEAALRLHRDRIEQAKMATNELTTMADITRRMAWLRSEYTILKKKQWDLARASWNAAGRSAHSNLDGTVVSYKDGLAADFPPPSEDAKVLSRPAAEYIKPTPTVCPPKAVANPTARTTECVSQIPNTQPQMEGTVSTPSQAPSVWSLFKKESAIDAISNAQRTEPRTGTNLGNVAPWVTAVYLNGIVGDARLLNDMAYFRYLLINTFNGVSWDDIVNLPPTGGCVFQRLHSNPSLWSTSDGSKAACVACVKHGRPCVLSTGNRSHSRILLPLPSSIRACENPRTIDYWIIPKSKRNYAKIDSAY
ncbi:hypothetical protein BDY21DRAFT_375409 [Lineolata rhizophorae]|uniref:Uncharacterized protein n=1 Tax=Lineolata rhizophorae TaxID=578093 RepID=A0A6A6NLI0_9PEZI|nr:hypothetical protein BDY21DRAFT_375409 [Lineolata rhizophorae]